MAKMVPTKMPENRPKSERKMFRILQEGLPENFTIFYSLVHNFFREEDSLEEGELDFLIIHREHGFLAIEVKGGEDIRYLPKRKKWLSKPRGGREQEISDPFKQVTRNIHNLVDEIAKRGIVEGVGRAFPFPFGFAVAFPDASVRTKEFPPNIKRELIIDMEDLGDISERIQSIMGLLPKRDYHRNISEQEYNDLMNKFFLPEFRLARSVSAQISEEEAELIRLTEQQYNILDALRLQPRAVIQGFAGTGKTLLAMEKAKRLASEGKSVLLLCFNRTLADFIRSRMADDSQMVTVDNYHRFARQIIKRAGLEFRPPRPENDIESSFFWNRTVPELLELAQQQTTVRFDAIIIDEGQDFNPAWLEGLMEFLDDKEKGCLYFFHDQHQNVYGRLPLPFEKQHPFLLDHNCRNTRKIGKLVARVGGIEDERYLAYNPEGEDVVYIPYDKHEEQPDLIADIINKLRRKGVLPQQIVVLSPHSLDTSCLSGAIQIAGLPLQEYEGDGGKGAIRFSTIKGFKGLESDITILCDVEENEPLEEYVAMSRAKHLLYIIHNREWEKPQERRNGN